MSERAKKRSPAKRRPRKAKRPEKPAAPPEAAPAPKVAEGAKCLVAIRLRGSSGIKPDVEQTLRSLRLFKKYHATLIYERPDVLGMLRKAKDMITWGEPSKDALSMLLEKRGRLQGDEKLTSKVVKNILDYPSVDRLATALLKAEVSLKKLWTRGVKPVFRLHPPSGGFKGTIKRPFNDMGELGYRGPAIDDLIKKMA